MCAAPPLCLHVDERSKLSRTLRLLDCKTIEIGGQNQRVEAVVAVPLGKPLPKKLNFTP